MSTQAFGRQLEPGATDRAAEARVPESRLRLIPPAARRSFVPWYGTPPGLAAGEDDLTRIAPGRPQADGEAIEIVGTLRDRDGRGLRFALIEIWNANRWGRYTHADDPATQPLDPHFLGHGRTLSDAEGRYRFTTIKPGAYLARADIGRWRPAHVHFSIRGGSARLVTQMYFAGDPHNARDPMFGLLGAAQARHLGVERETPPAAAAMRRFRFDIVIGGANATWFGS